MSDIVFDVGRLAGCEITVVGDVMLDQFCYGTVDRISPEAPVSIVDVNSRTESPGGAGNVAVNIASLGGRVCVVSSVGEDEAAARLESLICAHGSATSLLLKSKARTTSKKTRVVADTQQLVRIDEEELVECSPEEQQKICDVVAGQLAASSVLVVSDYGKGLVTDELAQQLIEMSAASATKIIVDTKRECWAPLRGASLITPNLAEFQKVVGKPVYNLDEIAHAASALQSEHELGGVLITLGPRGMMYVSGDCQEHIATVSSEVFDVSGAGDTVVALVALGLACGMDPLAASNLANVAAGIVVGKLGTASITPHELQRAIVTRPDALKLSVSLPDQPFELVRQWRSQGLKIGFTNGCFDLLHPGHIRLLETARSKCDRLVVGLNTDRSVRRLKGGGRPIQPENDRAFVLMALRAVDLVILFDEEVPEKLIEQVRPNSLFKGADYKLDDVVGAETVAKSGGEVVLVDLVEGKSTTDLIAKT